jgi:2-polyprenyl-3-methyl-5-hydroxy-6-metoxy-1,4-benzoquinol methylase
MTQRRTGDIVKVPGDYQYRAYQKGHPVQRFWHWAKYDTAITLAQVKPEQTMLDIGCGSGVLSYLVAKHHPRVLVIGIDANPQAIAFCNATYHLPNLKFKKGLVDTLKIKKQSIDTIFFLEVVEHIYPKQAKIVMRQFHKILKKSGEIIVSTPNYHSLWPLIELFLDRFKLVPTLDREQHVTKYDSQSLINLGKETGFRIKSQKSVNLLAPFVNIISNKAAKTIHRWETARDDNFGNLLVYSFMKE